MEVEENIEEKPKKEKKKPAKKSKPKKSEDLENILEQPVFKVKRKKG